MLGHSSDHENSGLNVRTMGINLAPATPCCIGASTPAYVLPLRGPMGFDNRKAACMKFSWMQEH